MNRVAGLAQLAAVLEASSEKPGNVSPTHSFHDMGYEDFLLSAIALTPGIRESAERGFSAGRGEFDVSEIGIGSLMKKCVLDIRSYVGKVNTHLGTVMLFVPLAAGAGLCLSTDSSIKKALRSYSKGVVAQSTLKDASDFYSAIEESGAGGLGGPLEKPDVSFYELMRLSSRKDEVASELFSGFPVVFKTGVPSFNRVHNQFGDPLKSILQTYLLILSMHPDSLIAKKAGLEAALDVSRRAGFVLEAGGVFSEEGSLAIREFDSFLRSEGNRLNPGSTADLVCASVFVWLLKNRL